VLTSRLPRPTACRGSLRSFSQEKIDATYTGLCRDLVRRFSWRRGMGRHCHPWRPGQSVKFSHVATVFGPSPARDMRMIPGLLLATWNDDQRLNISHGDKGVSPWSFRFRGLVPTTVGRPTDPASFLVIPQRPNLLSTFFTYLGTETVSAK
jgi:hypothetical protein